MGRISREIESGVSSISAIGNESSYSGRRGDGEWPLSSWETVDRKVKSPESKIRKKQVLLEGYVEATGGDEEDLVRTKSLTDEDLDDLKGCLDLGFGFNYDEIPELCSTLPALELCYSMSRKFSDDSLKATDSEAEASDSPPESAPAASPIPSWRISSPGDRPEDVKARLKFWAQTVACTVKLCS